MSTDIELHRAPITLWTLEEPKAALEQAAKVAHAAMELINNRGLIQTFPGSKKPHVMVDGWLCIARLAKARTEVVFEQPLKDDGGDIIRDPHGRPHGWEAKVRVLDAQGEVVADAVSQCARDESNWRNRDDYAVRSMAQTRATGKALRVALGFVATMAGFEATPAEEMPPPGPSDVPPDDGLFPPLGEELPVEDIDWPEPTQEDIFTNPIDHSEDDDREAQIAADYAAGFVPPSGKYSERGAQGPLTLAEIADVNPGWIKWARANVTAPDGFVEAVRIFAESRGLE